MNIYYKYNKKDINKLYKKLCIPKNSFYTHIVYFSKIHIYIRTCEQPTSSKNMQFFDADDFINFIKYNE